MMSSESATKPTPKFPEEPLHLSTKDGAGFYPVTIGQSLNGDKYKIVRKLGWGQYSSTWLARYAFQPIEAIINLTLCVPSGTVRESRRRMLRSRF